MGLTLEEVKARIKAPKNAQTVGKAKAHQARLQFHTESAMNRAEASAACTEFLEWVKTLLLKDKYNIFLNLFRYPTSNIELVSSIYEQLEKVFEGRNPVYNFNFKDQDTQEDWEEYRTEKLKEPDVWRSQGWEKVKTAINSVLIVDLPEEQTTDAPEPYFYWLDIGNVIDLDFDRETGAINFIAFKQSKKKITAIDSEFYRVFNLNDKEEIESFTEVPHDIGYTPARFFWTDSLMNKDKSVKASPLSNHLAQLDWLLFFATSKKHLDLYAPYPIYSTYEADCSFENGETGEYCDGGFLRDSENKYVLALGGTLKKCPVCSNKSLTGAGSLVEVPAPMSKDEPDLRNPVSITSIDSDSLDYNVQEQERLKKEIFDSVVGKGGEVNTSNSLNEMQVSSNFESRLSVLNNLKGNLEAAQMFVDSTVCKLRYADRFISGNISYGTEFFLYTLSDLYAQYKQAKENGGSEAELDALNDKILITEYKNNPVQLQRMLVLKQLEPYRHHTRAELLEYNSLGLLDKEKLIIKINFTTFVDRFERENTNVLEFAMNIDFKSKIDKIYKEFKKYANEQKESE